MIDDEENRARNNAARKRYKYNQDREAAMQKAGCTWTKCTCAVPSYALSMHNRVDFCEKLKEYEEIQFAR